MHTKRKSPTRHCRYQAVILAGVWRAPYFMAIAASNSFRILHVRDRKDIVFRARLSEEGPADVGQSDEVGARKHF